MDQLPRLGKKELICLLSFTCNYVVFVWRGFLFLWVLGMGYVILLWHSLSLPYNYFIYPSAGHVITGNLKIIPDSRIRNIVSKGPKYRFPSQIDFNRCREEIASALNDFGNRWCKRESVECKAMREWKLSFFQYCG